MANDKTGKDFLCDILRRAFLTKDDSYILYEMIREECIQALEDDKEVNLFDLVTLKSIDKPAHARNSFKGVVEVPDRKVVKARIYPRLKKLWKSKK